jgi:hypothetical protein
MQPAARAAVAEGARTLSLPQQQGSLALRGAGESFRGEDLRVLQLLHRPFRTGAPRDGRIPLGRHRAAAAVLRAQPRRGVDRRDLAGRHPGATVVRGGAGRRIARAHRLERLILRNAACGSPLKHAVGRSRMSAGQSRHPPRGRPLNNVTSNAVLQVVGFCIATLLATGVLVLARLNERNAAPDGLAPFRTRRKFHDVIQPPHLHPDPRRDGRCRLRLRCVRAGPARRERAASRGARLRRRFGQGRCEEIPEARNA